MRCVICGHKFSKDDPGYVKGSISGEILELLPSGPKATGQVLRHENILICLAHFEAIPIHISENLKMNAQERAK